MAIMDKNRNFKPCLNEKEKDEKVYPFPIKDAPKRNDIYRNIMIKTLNKVSEIKSKSILAPRINRESHLGYGRAGLNFSKQFQVQKIGKK